VRKLLLIITTGCAMVAFAPATALAKRHDHHRRHHHHARVHHKRFGSDDSSANSAQSAGKIQTFTGGVLTIVLNDGSTVSGRVTLDTEIECAAGDMVGMSHDSSGGSDDNGDQGQAGNPGHGDNQGDNDQGDNDRGDNDQGDNDPGDDDRGDEQAEGQACGPADLMRNAVVQEAELSISRAGAIWSKVELAGQSSSLSGSDS
jgi:hypothetical protein